MNRQIIFLYFATTQIVFTIFWWIIKDPSSVGLFVSLIWSSFLMVPLNVIVINLLTICHVIPSNPTQWIRGVSFETMVFGILSYVFDFYFIEDSWLSCDFNKFYMLGLVISIMVILIMAFGKITLLILTKCLNFKYFKGNTCSFPNFQSSMKSKSCHKVNCHLKYGHLLLSSLIMVIIMILGYHIFGGMYDEGRVDPLTGNYAYTFE